MFIYKLSYMGSDPPLPPPQLFSQLIKLVSCFCGHSFDLSPLAHPLCELSATFDAIPRPESVGQSMEGGVVKRLAGRDENSKTIRLLNVTLL